ncbi:sensor histidine kinase [Sulfurospirillum sp. 1612]|uniref:sensor histidine kinase n=1 Tax=Sulfurospirillum sp. 1612 TaxID=3094835 RepID=UPI002F929E91
MAHHEKSAFLKFFLIYFLSVAILILMAGSFYFIEMKNQFLKAEEFSIIDYARHIKIMDNSDSFDHTFHHTYVDKKGEYIDIRNFTITQNAFIKYVPMDQYGNYLKITKTKAHFLSHLKELKVEIITIQIILLLLFALLSFRLAKNALKPLEKSITTLDKFAKDLIHDLNTPVTSIKLNMKLLEKQLDAKENKAIQRLNKSVQTISELHENLTILLEEETFQMQKTNLFPIVQEIVQIQEPLYPHLNFKIEFSSFEAKVNPKAMKQILQNIIANACKYNKKHGYIKIYVSHNALYIQDGGSGIKEPEKIFDRSYSGKQSSGIGLDIVKRLAYAMKIQIQVQSNHEGSIFILTMR